MSNTLLVIVPSEQEEGEHIIVPHVDLPNSVIEELDCDIDSIMFVAIPWKKRVITAIINSDRKIINHACYNIDDLYRYLRKKRADALDEANDVNDSDVMPDDQLFETYDSDILEPILRVGIPKDTLNSILSFYDHTRFAYLFASPASWDTDKFDGSSDSIDFEEVIRVIGLETIESASEYTVLGSLQLAREALLLDCLNAFDVGERVRRNGDSAINWSVLLFNAARALINANLGRFGPSNTDEDLYPHLRGEPRNYNDVFQGLIEMHRKQQEQDERDKETAAGRKRRRRA